MRGVHEFAIGDRVKLSGKFLRNTGQITGRAGLDVFTITGFDRDWAITDQPVARAILDGYTAAELATDPTLRYRRINVGNLVRVGTGSSRNSP